MKIRPVLIFLILATCQLVLGQKAPKGFIGIDASPKNFTKVLSYESPTKLEIDTLIQLGRNYTQVNKDSAYLIIDHAIEKTRANISKGREWHNNYARALISKGTAMSKFGDASEGVKTMILARDNFELIDNQRGVASAERFLGMHFFNIDEWERSATHYLNSISKYIETKTDPRALVGPYEGLSDVYFNLGNFDKAQKYLNNAIQIADTTDIAYHETYLRRRQANILMERGSNYLLKADSSPPMSVVFKDSADFFFKSGEEQANLAVSAAREQKDPTIILESLLTEAEIKNTLEQYKNALDLSGEAENLIVNINDPLLICRTYIQRAKALLGLRRIDKSYSYTKDALKTANANNYDLIKLEAQELLTQLYIFKAKPKDAIKALEERNKLTKLLNSSATKKAIVSAETKYLTAEKERKIITQEKEILELGYSNAEIQRQRNYLTFGGLMMILFCFFSYWINKIRRERNDKKQFAEAIIIAQEAERKRIARDLHDGVGQSLLLIKKQLESTQEATNSNKQLITETLEEVRMISRDLHPIHLEKFGLTAAIENLIDRIKESTNLFVSKVIPDIDGAFSEKNEIHLYRTIQEAFNNVVKHSQASAINLQIVDDKKGISVIIQDNGIGFNQEESSLLKNSLGLRTMQERVETMDGKILFKKGEHGGTVIDIFIPKL